MLLTVPANVCLLVFVIVQGVEGVNVAVGKPATQSSNQASFATADKAVDGNSDKHFTRGSCSHTSCGDHSPWWMVDLGKIYAISSVTIANSYEAEGRMKNFQIQIFPKDPKSGAKYTLCVSQGGKALPSGKETTLTCSRPVRGRFVRITKTFRTHCDALIMCEVMVNGEEVFDCGANFVKSDETCYFYSPHKAGNWFQARDMCRALGADLAIADTQRKVKFLKSGLKSLGKLSGRIYYLGGHAFGGGLAFQWLDPSALSIGVFNDWDKATNPRDPEPNKDEELCFGMHRQHHFAWHNIHCNRREHFICGKSLTWPRPLE